MQAANANTSGATTNGVETCATDDFVTVYVGEKLFGLAIERVHDVFVPSGVTPVPLAPAEIVGLLNLRGRVVTAMSLRRRLGLPDPEAEADGTKASPKMAIGLEQAGETFALVVDGVGEVLKLGADSREAVPINLDPRFRDLATCVHRLDGRLLVILDVDALLGFTPAGAKAA